MADTQHHQTEAGPETAREATADSGLMRSDRALGAILITFSLLVMAALGMALYGFVASERNAALEQVEAHTIALTEMQRQTIDQRLQAHDAFLRMVARLLHSGHSPASLEPLLAARRATQSDIMDLLVLDGEGRITAWTGSGSPPDVRERAYFTVYRTSPAPSLAITPPMPSLVHEGRWFFALSRPLHSDDSLTGVVVAILDIDRFAEAFGRQLSESETTLLLAGHDGRAYFRLPRLAGDTEMQLPAIAALQGNIPPQIVRHIRSEFDGRDRLAVVQPLANLPLVVSATSDLAAAQQQGERLAAQALSAYLLFVLLGTGATGFMLLGLRTRARARDALQAREARLRQVTEQRQQAEQRLSKLASHLPGVIYQFHWRNDGSSGFPYASEGMLRIYGVDPQRVRDDAGAVFATLHPNDLERVHTSILASREQLTPWQIEYRVNHPDGHMLWVEGRAMPERLPDGSTLWHGYIADITGRKEIEQRLQQITDNINEVVWIRSAAEMLYISPSYERVWGRSVESLYRHPDSFVEAIHPDDRSRVLEALQAEISAGQLFDMSYRIVRPDGEVRWIQARSYPVRDEQGRLYRSAGTAIDITDRKVVEEELARSNTELEQFAYAISHDMRQPLRMITGHLGTLERALGDRIDDDERESMRFAIDGARRMDQMIVGLLDYSRVGRKTEPKAEIESRDALEEALAFLGPAIEEHGAQISVEGDWPRLVASRDELTRLLQNLIGNAVKYRVPERTPEITLNGELIEARWRVTIRDNGVGFDPAQAGRLFRVFSRLHARSQYEGSGVGLALCRRIVEHHHGTLWASSAGNGQGATFCFELPL